MVNLVFWALPCTPRFLIAFKIIIHICFHKHLLSAWTSLRDWRILGFLIWLSDGVGGSLEAVGSVLGSAEEIELKFLALREDIS